MTETNNKAKMAERLSKNLLKTFGWERVGALNTNWSCCDPGHSVPNHTTDAVFCYDDPSRDGRLYFNTDLKSYSRTTITRGKIASAVASLLPTIECARSSQQWREMYTSPDHACQVHGLLFVYNHDDGWHDGFMPMLTAIDDKKFRSQAGCVSYVFGPEQIRWLDAVSNDIWSARGRGDMPQPGVGGCGFFYPPGVRVRYRNTVLPSASIEMLLGPWLILRASVENVDTYWVYYRHDGASPDDFKYLLDFFFRSSMLHRSSRVVIRQAQGSALAQANLDRAKQAYALHFPPLEELKTRLAQVTLERIQTVRTRFDEAELGMD